jgi:hypothetical protein
MASEVLQIEPSLEAQNFGQVIDDVPLRFEFYWNARDQAHYVNILNEDDAPILSGVKVTVGWDLLYNRDDDELPDGALMVEDSSGEGTQPGKYELGDRVKIIYLPRP